MKTNSSWSIKLRQTQNREKVRNNWYSIRKWPHLSMSAFKDHRKRSVSDQLLPTELKLPDRLHVAADFRLLWSGRPRWTLSGVSALRRRVRAAAARLSGPYSTIRGLPSWRQLLLFSHVSGWSSSPQRAASTVGPMLELQHRGTLVSDGLP